MICKSFQNFKTQVPLSQKLEEVTLKPEDTADIKVLLGKTFSYIGFETKNSNLPQIEDTQLCGKILIDLAIKGSSISSIGCVESELPTKTSEFLYLTQF